MGVIDANNAIRVYKGFSCCRSCGFPHVTQRNLNGDYNGFAEAAADIIKQQCCLLPMLLFIKTRNGLTPAQRVKVKRDTTC